MRTVVSAAPSPVQQVGIAVIDTQRKPVTYALLAASGFFLLLAGKNLLDHDYVAVALCGVTMVVAWAYAQLNGVTAFRVSAILIISSAFAQIYARIMAAHQERQEEQRQHLDLMVSCANTGGTEPAEGTQRVARPLHRHGKPRISHPVGDHFVVQ